MVVVKDIVDRFVTAHEIIYLSRMSTKSLEPDLVHVYMGGALSRQLINIQN